MITANGIIIRTGLEKIRSIGRNTQGVRLIKLKAGDKLVAAEKISPEDVNFSKEKVITNQELKSESEPKPELKLKAKRKSKPKSKTKVKAKRKTKPKPKARLEPKRKKKSSKKTRKSK